MGILNAVADVTIAPNELFGEYWPLGLLGLALAVFAGLWWWRRP